VSIKKYPRAESETRKVRKSGKASRSVRGSAQETGEPNFGAPNVITFEPLFKRAKTVKDVLTGAVAKSQTAIYIHGIGNHPEEQVLVVRWDRALFGKDMGERSRMAYWVNRARYPQPVVCDCIDPKCACHDPQDAPRMRGFLAIGQPQPKVELEVALQEITQVPAEQDFLRGLGLEMLKRAKVEAALGKRSEGKGTFGMRSKGIGDVLLRGVTSMVTDMMLPDVQDFLFDATHRKQMEDIFLARLQSGGGPFVVIAHSQGTMIAYDVLRQLQKSDIEVKLFITIGSPLGLPPVRSVFKKWTKQKKLPFPPCVTRWLNVAAIGDVVAFDPDLKDDIGPHADGAFTNYIIPRAERDANPLFNGNAHAVMGYLSTQIVQTWVYEAVGREFARSLGRQVITSDLVERFETESDSFRHPVLIEVADRLGKKRLSIDEGRQRIHQRLLQLSKDGKQPLETFAIMHSSRYVSARLRRSEIEVLRSEFDNLQVQRLWQNAKKRALISRSAQMVQATPAQQAYGAYGHNIEWAVLDTGINHHHPHFAMHRNVASLWDCTDPSLRNHDSAEISEPVGGFIDWSGEQPVWPAGADEMIDRFGHGTHVSGIIAGEYAGLLEDDGERMRFAGMAPKAKLHSFKVLDDHGQGDDAWILMALDKIASINEQASTLRIHGVNLSLGGNFDPSVFGCGHTPLCVELRRLWRQGVLVTLAAGNEGFAVLRTLEDGPWQANIDLSIGDPANLEEAIAVGSVHRLNPHTYGVSYFSSRGPTADGRNKPDLVAPGEKIMSARADFEARLKLRKRGESPTAEDFYVAESGTSMATPHVSGVLAAFLSLRREFIGYPDRVKKILLANCTDLERDRYAQGAGIPNLVKMLAGT
jgi:Subtilase family